jgi:hypothetical protein
MEFLALIFSIIVFCIFVGIFLRLGRIEIILKKMAIHQGAIENETSKQTRASKGKFNLGRD